MKNMNLLSAKNVIKSALVASAFIVSSAYATTVQWTGLGDFDSSSITFSPIQASHMDFIDGFGNSAEYHAHNGLANGMLNLQLNGVWTNVYTGSTVGDFYLNGLAVDFASSQVTGAMWTTTTPQGQSFHGFYNVSLDFTDPNPSAVPEPTTVALLGLGLLGFAASRRKSAKSKNA